MQHITNMSNTPRCILSHDKLPSSSSASPLSTPTSSDLVPDPEQDTRPILETAAPHVISTSPVICSLENDLSRNFHSNKAVNGSFRFASTSIVPGSIYSSTTNSKLFKIAYRNPMTRYLLQKSFHVVFACTDPVFQ